MVINENKLSLNLLSQIPNQIVFNKKKTCLLYVDFPH